MNFSIVYILIYEGKNEVVLKTFTVSTNSKLSGHDFLPIFYQFSSSCFEPLSLRSHEMAE